MFQFNYFTNLCFKDLNFLLQKFFNFSQNICTSFSLIYISKLYKVLDLKNFLLLYGYLQVTLIIQWQSFSKNSELATSVSNFQYHLVVSILFVTLCETTSFPKSLCNELFCKFPCQFPNRNSYTFTYSWLFLSCNFTRNIKLINIK